MTLPNFLIIGAAKSGTTSLAVNLSAHPDVFMAPGEVHFFSDDANWSRGLSSYESHFAEASTAITAIGEKSPSYLYAPRAPARIAQTLGRSDRFICIAILREPAARTLSQIEHRRRLGVESRPTVDAAVASLSAEPATYDYLGRGKYAEQLARYIDAVGVDAVHVEFYEDLRREPHAVLARVVERLGLRPFTFPQADRRANQSATIRYPRLYRSLIRVQAGRWLPRPVAVRTWGMLQSPVRYEPLPLEVSRRLREWYEPHNRDLELLLGRPLPIEWTAPPVD